MTTLITLAAVPFAFGIVYSLLRVVAVSLSITDAVETWE